MTRLLPASALLALLLAGLAPAASAQSGEAAECTDDRNEKLIHYSLYAETFKAGDYETALPDLEWILACDPTFTGRDPDARNIRRGIQAYDSLAARAADPAEQQVYLDKALALIDTAPSILQDAGVTVEPHEYVLRKGRFIQGRPDLLADQQPMVYDLFLEAFEMQPDSLSDYYINFLAGERVRRALEEDTPEAKVAARDFLTAELQPRADDPAYIDGLMESLITTPREQYAFLKERYQEDPESLSEDEVKTLYSLNQNPELKDDELNRTLREVMLTLDPTPNLLQIFARQSADEGDYDAAQDFYDRALALTEDPMEKRDINYNIAVFKQSQGQRASAANYARAALGFDQNHGPSHYLIASLAQQSVGGGDARARAAYWCVADLYSRAASAAATSGDNDLAATARRAAANAASAGPSAEDYIFIGWKPGQQITASYGWGSCTTRVR